MNKEVILKNTIDNMRLLSESKIQEVNDFVEFLLNKQESILLTSEIQQAISESKTFNFLHEEPDLYTVDNLKVKSLFKDSISLC